MKIKCDVCNSVYQFPIEVNRHKHKEMELDGVPCNFWTLIDDKFSLLINNEKQGTFRFKDLYPNVIKELSLNEGNTPLIKYKKNLFFKEENKNPTGSFKDRGMPFLMNEVLYHKKNSIAICSTGNAAVSLVKYAKLYGIESIIFVPKDIDESKRKMLAAANYIIYSNDIIKSFEDCINYCNNNENVFNGFLSTNQSYLLGLETMSYEIYIQLNNKVPDYIIIPCASGGNVISQYNAWSKMLRNKIISKLPKIVIVQIDGGNPIEKGYNSNKSDELYVIDNPVDSKTILSCDTCFNYFKIYNIIEENVGITVSVSDGDIECLSNDLKEKYEYTSLASIAAFNKIRIKENEICVAIMTAKNKENN